MYKNSHEIVIALSRSLGVNLATSCFVILKHYYRSNTVLDLRLVKAEARFMNVNKLRFLDIILRILRHQTSQVSVYNVFFTNLFQPPFAQKSVSRGDCA